MNTGQSVTMQTTFLLFKYCVRKSANLIPFFDILFVIRVAVFFFMFPISMAP